MLRHSMPWPGTLSRANNLLGPDLRSRGEAVSHLCRHQGEEKGPSPWRDDYGARFSHPVVAGFRLIPSPSSESPPHPRP